METKEKKLTIADIAEHLGVSKTTVSRAMSGKGRISEETVRRVQEYIAAADYKPNVIAKGLAQSKTYNIAVILPVDCNVTELPFFQSCMYGICEAAAKRDYDVLAVYTKAGETGALERIISNHKIDGVILSRTLIKDAAAEYVKEKRVPLVAVGSSPDSSLVQVDNDHRSACRELTGRLLDKGYRNIALIGGNETHIVTRSRYEGFADAFCLAAKPVNPELITLGLETAEEMEAAVDELLLKGAECIVCMDDMICSHVLEELQKKGISVPEQVTVASFYRGSLAEQKKYQIPSLEFDAGELGRAAGNILLDLIEDAETAAKTLLPYKIVAY